MPSARSFLRCAVRYGFVPLMMLLAGGGGAALASRDAPAAAFAALVLLGVALSFAAERVLPFEASWNAADGDGARDVAHALVNECLALGAVAVLPALASAVAAASPVAGTWPVAWPMAMQVLLAVLVADVGITLAHLASHRVAFLWRLHAVHHSVTRFYGFNGLLKHPLHQLVETAAGTAPLVAMGLPVPVASALAVCVAFQLLLQHSNVDYRVGPFTTVLALNRGHRFHHLNRGGEGDVNFGLFLLVWDRILGTFRFDPGRRFVSADLGVEGRPDYPRRYLAQLVEPFVGGR